MKEYLAGKTYDDIKPAAVVKNTGSNLPEMTDKAKLAIIELLRAGKRPGDIKAEYKAGTKSYAKSQIREVEADWKEALAELAPKEIAIKEDEPVVIEK